MRVARGSDMTGSVSAVTFESKPFPTEVIDGRPESAALEAPQLGGIEQGLGVLPVAVDVRGPPDDLVRQRDARARVCEVTHPVGGGRVAGKRHVRTVREHDDGLELLALVV